MIKLLIKLFVKDFEAIDKTYVRESYGVLAGVLGVICNLILFVTKLMIGYFIGSIAITSDAFNNLSDTGSSLVAIIGAKLSSRDADNEHPYGHGRFEYVASLIISFIILLVGFELLKSSFNKVLHPSMVLMSPITIVILSLTVIVKLWMYSYNHYIGKLIGSGVSLATATDSLNDVIATSAVIFTTIIGAWLKIPLDGYAGIIVSLLIMYTGYGIAKETVNILLGMSPSEETVNKIMELLNSSESIQGAHDLNVHDYGPGRIIASVHAELSDQTDIVKAHTIIDGLEKRAKSELGIDLLIHVDPMGEGQIGPID